MPERAPSVDRYRELYQLAKRQAWDPLAIDLTRDAEDWDRIRREYERERYAEQIHRLCSLFYEGEASVATTLAPFVDAVTRAGLPIETEMFLAVQLYEETRHLEFFSRYFREVLHEDRGATERDLTAAPRAVLVDGLTSVANGIRREDDGIRLRACLVEGVAHYMGVVEGMMARTGYFGASEALNARGWLPGLQEGFRLIRMDEGRHVAFGMRFLADLTAAEPALRTTALDAVERLMPDVLGTIASFEYPYPIVEIARLVEFAMGAARQFLIGAGLVQGDPSAGAEDPSLSFLT